MSLKEQLTLLTTLILRISLTTALNIQTGKIGNAGSNVLFYAAISLKTIA